MNKDDILSALQNEVEGYNKIIATENGDWIVKGFIDIYKRVYTISVDTKVVSKVIELLLIPAFIDFAKRNELTIEFPPQQNFYPDISFTSNNTGEKYAVDIKSTFLDKKGKGKSMTLGAFTGYFRDRKSTKNTLYPYGEYAAHLVLGVVYSQNEINSNQKTIFPVEEIENIESVIKDFKFFVQPKYKIASASPGSGNTKNIGSTNNIDKLLNGQGIFSKLGEEVFDDYWMHYLTKDMAKASDSPIPYSNLKSYLEYRQQGNSIKDILDKYKDELIQLEKEEETTNEATNDE